jgi:hypothetical protein
MQLATTAHSRKPWLSLIWSWSWLDRSWWPNCTLSHEGNAQVFSWHIGRKFGWNIPSIHTENITRSACSFFIYLCLTMCEETSIDEFIVS